MQTRVTSSTNVTMRTMLAIRAPPAAIPAIAPVDSFRDLTVGNIEGGVSVLMPADSVGEGVLVLTPVDCVGEGDSTIALV